ncbi:MAG: GNAT family N-acetyltransferase [Clostridiaceae bacterium]
MKEKALSYLIKNPLLHMGMIEPIRRGTADLFYAEADGVLMKEQKSNVYMISVENYDRGKELVKGISNCRLIVAHQKCMADYIFKKLGLAQIIECVQAVYLSKIRLNNEIDLEIRQLEPVKKSLIFEHYDMLTEEELEELLRNGNLYGGYKEGTFVGFIGNHLEGGLGILEIFPQYRRLGYGSALECHMVNKMIEKGLVPYAQIETSNKKSIALQKKLGFSISEGKLYWMIK